MSGGLDLASIGHQALLVNRPKWASAEDTET
jgi:hypothetical protein